jgi:hypothetical protein
MFDVLDVVRCPTATSQVELDTRFGDRLAGPFALHRSQVDPVVTSVAPAGSGRERSQPTASGATRHRRSVPR